MPDYSFLSNPASANYQAPNLLGMAGQAMTLGSMAQQQQLQALQLQKQQDLIGLMGSPQGTQFLQSLLNPGGGGGAGGSGGPPQLDSSFLSGHVAAPEFLGTSMGLAKEAAAVQQSYAQTAKDKQDAAQMEWQNLGRVALSVKTDPNDPNYDPQLISQVATNVA